MKNFAIIFCVLFGSLMASAKTEGKHPMPLPSNCPKFVFFNRNSDYTSCGDGNVNVSIALCPNSYTGSCTINSVTWTMQTGGTPIVTSTLDITHAYATSGDYLVTAVVNCTVVDGSSITVCNQNVIYSTTGAIGGSVTDLCNTTSTVTNFPVSATVFDLSIYASISTLIPPQPPSFTTADLICFPYTFYGSISNLIGVSSTAKIYVDGVLISTLNYPFSSGQTTAATYSEGQHIVEIIINLKDPSICSYTSSSVFEVLPVTTPCGTSCFTFQPQANERYWVSAWVKAGVSSPVKTYEDLGGFVEIGYTGNSTLTKLYPTGEIIDGWQRVAGEFTVPASPTATQVKVNLVNNSTVSMYFDDIRIHPFNASMKSYVYDPETFWLLAELDDNNYSTFYEYDKEGQLIRIKKETEKGVMTIQESRSKNPKN